jgi:hypothetical protein
MMSGDCTSGETAPFFDVCFPGYCTVVLMRCHPEHLYLCQLRSGTHARIPLAGLESKYAHKAFYHDTGFGSHQPGLAWSGGALIENFCVG